MTKHIDNDFVQDIVSRPSNNYSATVIADSINPNGFEHTRLITLQLKYPRFIHSEMMTHKRFSRNASSSRARPIAKEIERIRENPAIPIYWGKNQSGMQAKEELQGEELEIAKDIWNLSIREATAVATSFNKLEVHKQVANRILEPYQLMEAVFTGNIDAWKAFFDLRIHPDAQPEIIKLAYMIREAINNSSALESLYHLPYVYDNEINLYSSTDLMRISSARCARVSYKSFDGTVDVDKDIALANRLLEADPPHASPAEHCAYAMLNSPNDKFANFIGWKNYRNLLEGK